MDTSVINPQESVESLWLFHWENQLISVICLWLELHFLCFVFDSLKGVIRKSDYTGSF